MISKPKLVIDLRMISMSGIGTYLQNILPFIIDSQKFDITFLGYDNLNEFSYLNNGEIIPMVSPILGIKEQIELSQLIPKCDIFWAPNWNAPLLKSRASRLVTTIHDINHIVNPNQFGWTKYFLAKKMVGACIRKSNAIVTVSQFSKSEIVKFFPKAKDKVFAFPLSVSPDFNKFSPHDISLSNYLLAVGNVKPHKNLKQALEAFSQINLPELKFVIVGKQDGFKTGYGIELNELIAKLGNRVFFTGEVNENVLRNYYFNARGFVFPSLYEGFGLPLLEAMKFNLPILASNRASIPEVVSPKAILFDPTVNGDIVEKMELLLANFPEGSRVDYSDHLSKFSWENTANKHIELFSKIITS